MEKQRAMYLVYRIFAVMAEKEVWKDTAIGELVADGEITADERDKLACHFNCPFCVYTEYSEWASKSRSDCPDCPGLELWERGAHTKSGWTQCEAYEESPWLLCIRAFSTRNLDEMVKNARVISEWAKNNVGEAIK